MIVRTYKVDNLIQVKVAMDFVQENAEQIGMKCLKRVLMTKPRAYMIKRTPLATPRRYNNYYRKDGKVTKRRSHVAGDSMTLRNATQNNPVRETNDRNTVTFGSHATATVDYAGYVHEAVKPREGQYWHEGMYGYGRGWTTQGTGNRFVEKAVTEYADYIPEHVTIEMDKELGGYRA